MIILRSLREIANNSKCNLFYGRFMAFFNFFKLINKIVWIKIKEKMEEKFIISTFWWLKEKSLIFHWKLKFTGLFKSTHELLNSSMLFWFRSSKLWWNAPFVETQYCRSYSAVEIHIYKSLDSSPLLTNS